VIPSAILKDDSQLLTRLRSSGKTYQGLQRRGVEFEGPSQKQLWDTYAMFKDSEGNRFVSFV
jgi:hypothetical protein